MTEMNIPTLSEFLAAPIEEIAKVAPATLVYGAGGTRRRAVFEGIEPWSDAFVHWARTGILSRIELLFRHGVQNVIVTLLTPDNFREVNQYREQLLTRAQWVVAGPESLTDYERSGWRVRLLGADDLPELDATPMLLRRSTPTQGGHTLYWNIVATPESQWEQLLAASRHAQAKNRAEAILALYGEEIPPATLYLGFGKPTLLPEVIPPLLIDQIQSYWSQQPGYTLTEAQLRTILYDYAYLRPTWRANKLDRAKDALAHRTAWEEGPILGLGMHLGPFWYPAPMSSSAWPANHLPSED